MTSTPQTIAPEVTEGTVFVSRWGYDQTNTDFYRVVKRTPKMVALQRVGSEAMTSETTMSGTVVPNFAAPMGEPFRVKLHTPPHSSRAYVQINSYAVASVWDGTPQFESSWA